MKRFLILVISAVLALIDGVFGQHIIPCRLTVEYQDGTQPLATNVPRFSWNYETGAENVRQTSYRIIVATTEELAWHGTGDLWDSKTVNSDQMLLIPYEGKPLHSRNKAYWRIYTTLTCGDSNTAVTATSAVNKFEISLLSPNDWSAQWIGGNFDNDSLGQKTRIAARYLRKEFSLRGDIREARLYICGLGQYSAFINHTEVAPEEILKPALSDYSKRVYFNAYNVTDLLHKGNNAIGVILAGGRYFTLRYNKSEKEWGGQMHAMHYGSPRMIAQLEVTYTDGTTEHIVSNGSWKITNQGPVRTSNEFDGETYNEKMDLGLWTGTDYDDSKWIQAEAVYPPEGTLTPQPNPNIAVQDTVRPIAMFRKGKAWILDMGQNMVGYLNMELNASRLQNGDTLTLRFAELLKPDSNLYVDNLRSAEATDRYIVSSVETRHGTSLQWHPTFTYHGFRYVEISGLREEPKLENFQGLVFYDKMTAIGRFGTSNEILNAVHRNAY